MNKMFEPVPNILSWEIEEESTRKALSSYADALNKLVSIGTHLLIWEISKDNDATVSIDENVVVASFFKRLLELLDSIALQVKAGAVSTAVVQLRALFELSVQFEHLLEQDTLNRSYCTMLTDWYRQLEILEKVDVTKRTVEEIEEIKRLLFLIDQPVLSSVNNEYKKIRNKKSKGEIKWYNLFAPRLSDFSKLISEKYTKYKTPYQYINKGFGNDAVHSTDLLRTNLAKVKGFPAITQMRNPTEVLPLAGISFAIVKTSCELFVKRRSKSKQSEYISAIMECEKTHKYIAFSGLSPEITVVYS